jgi:hypothetical protein
VFQVKSLYDATLWIVGYQFAPAEPHAFDVEPGKSVSAETLVSTANGRDAQAQSRRRIAACSVAPGDKATDAERAGGRSARGFCPRDGRTLAYYNGRSQGEVDDTTLCPAIISVWLHPQSKSKEMRKSLRGQ